jgi:predicted phage baseplate assembly protein
MLQRKATAWTDHNVSDPGVTLIETFAYMVDLMLFRLNQVPDKMFVKFLELVGITLFPPNAASTDLTFRLSAAQGDVITVPKYSRASTPRPSAAVAPIFFETVEDLKIIPSSLYACITVDSQGLEHDWSNTANRSPFAAFSDPPVIGETLVIGLPNAVPSNLINLRFNCKIEGVGVNPDHPPLVWEAFDGVSWRECELESDGTGGLNRPGDIAIHIPRSHTETLVSGERAGWIRCRIVEVPKEYPPYSSSPRIRGLSVFTIGGTVGAINAESHENEIVGTSNGVPGQFFDLAFRPVVKPLQPIVVEVGGVEGWTNWTVVDDFSKSTVDDRHFKFDLSAGQIIFGPALRLDDGTLRYYGAVPEKGAPIRIAKYQSGGGRSGNVAEGAISVLKSTIPMVSKVENRTPASGGVDGEDLDQAKIRGPIALRSLERAVTLEDYEVIARIAAPEMARIHAVNLPSDGDSGTIRLLVVPSIDTDALGRVEFGSLAPRELSLTQMAKYIDDRRVVGARVKIEPPTYQGVTVVALIKATSTADPERISREAEAILYRYLSPLDGGVDGKGWPLGRTLHAGELFALLQRINGVAEVTDLRLFLADLSSGTRSSAVNKVEIGPSTLIFPFEHQVRIN